MTDDLFDNDFRERTWRRKLTPAEESQLRGWLAANPEAQADWEAEMRLTETLAHVTDAPVPSNFTARVIEAVELEAKTADQASRGGRAGRFWIRWLPRTALAAVAVTAGLLSYEHVQESKHQQQISSLRLVAEVASLPDPQSLLDFDVIQVMSQTPATPIRSTSKSRAPMSEPAADVELLSLLQ